MSPLRSFIAALLVACLVAVQTSAFVSPSTSNNNKAVSTASSSSQLNFGPFSAPKDDGKPGDYVCKVS